jgi:hypothetical protein
LAFTEPNAAMFFSTTSVASAVAETPGAYHPQQVITPRAGGATVV